jgi:hypothetical protein
MDKQLTLTVKWQNDLSQTWTKPKDHILEIVKSMTKSKSIENFWTKYDFSLFYFPKQDDVYDLKWISLLT